MLNGYVYCWVCLDTSLGACCPREEVSLPALPSSRAAAPHGAMRSQAATGPIVVLGATGQLGGALARLLGAQGVALPRAAARPRLPVPS